MNIYDYQIHLDPYTIIVNYSFDRVHASFPEGDFTEDNNFDFDIQEIFDEDGTDIPEAEFKKIEPNYLTIIQNEIEKP